MTTSSEVTFKQDYKKHLQHLKLKSLRPKTIEAYSRAIRRIGKYFDSQINDLSEQQLRFLRVVQQNTERLTILVNDLLDLSRIEAGQVRLTIQSIDLAELIDGVMEEIDRLTVAENKSMQFKIDLPPDLPRIQGDPERIRQILINLFGNSGPVGPA